MLHSMQLEFDPGLCVRAKSKFSDCTKCVDVSASSVQLVDNLPSFARSTGVEAAACVGVCPTGAMKLLGFSATEFFFHFLKSKVRLISPKINIPCVSVLSVEHLLSLALASDETISIDLDSYEKGSSLLLHIEAMIEEVNFILSSFCKKQIETNLLDPEPEKRNLSTAGELEEISRRSFLKQATLKEALKHKKAFDDAVNADNIERFEIDIGAISTIREKHLPDKRKILLTTLKKAEIPTRFEIIPQEEIRFVSQKYITDECTNCQMCYRVCPTGALSSDSRFSLIHFDTMLCLKCHLCHDVCEPKAILLQDSFEIKEFFEPTQRTLALFDIRRCIECGANFTYRDGEQICPRCALEEEEAITLHSNAKKMGS